jgi:hypothetical protein
MRLLASLVVLVALSLPAQVGVSARQGDTFTFSIDASLCDGDPRLDTATVTCEPFAGLLVTVALESGEVIGSCVVETFPTPNGEGSSCGVDGAPLNVTFVIIADESTVPAGYVAMDNPQTLQVGDLIPGGGDGPTLSFLLIPVDAEVPEAQEPTAAPTPVPTAVPEDPEPAKVAAEVIEPTPAPQEGGNGDDVEEPISDESGRPAAIYAGTCEDLGDVVAELPDVTGAEGPAVGQRSAIEAEDATATVDVALDDLLDDDHAVAVLGSDEEDAPVVACGEIGGVDDDDGELVVGLREVDDSGFAGVAYLAYGGADDSQTVVSLFLAEGLADEE